MKYARGYSLITGLTGFFSRTILHFRSTELHYMLSRIHGQRILDYGCNTGYFTRMIKHAHPSSCVTGADINSYALKNARKKNPSINFLPTHSIIRRKTLFDTIVLSHVIEHIHEREMFLQQLVEKLSPAGRLIIAVPQERIRGDATPIQLAYNCITLQFENPHVVKLNYEDMCHLLDKIDFKVDEMTYTNYLPPFTSQSPLWHRWSMVVVASRKQSKMRRTDK